jgi:hypothetical protein
MNTKALFAGVFAALLAMALLPGAFAQQTGASPEAETEVPGGYLRRGMIDNMYAVCCYEIFPLQPSRLMAFMGTAPVISTFMKIGGLFETLIFAVPLLFILGGITAMFVGGDVRAGARQWFDEATGASVRAATGTMHGLGVMFEGTAIEPYLKRGYEFLAEGLTRFFSIPILGPLSFHCGGDLLLQHTWGPGRYEAMPEIYQKPKMLLGF